MKKLNETVLTQRFINHFLGVATATMNNKRFSKLDELVEKGTLSSYSVMNLDDSGNPGKSHDRNSEQLTLYFPDGEKLVLSTWCSGCLEDSGFSVDNP